MRGGHPLHNKRLAERVRICGRARAARSPPRPSRNVSVAVSFGDLGLVGNRNMPKGDMDVQDFEARVTAL